MGKPDVAIKLFLDKPERFADLFNHYFFEGKSVIQPEELVNIDRESDFLFWDKGNKEQTVLRHRDLAKRWKNKCMLSILACEIQDKVHYAMPVRVMTSDSLSYNDQIRRSWDKKPEAKKRKGITEAEYLSRFLKDDRLCPVLTLVFYYATQKWDGPTDLHGMFRDVDPSLLKYIPNYPIHIIDLYHSDELTKLKSYRSDLQIIFGMLKYKQEKEGLLQYLHNNESFFNGIDMETWSAIGVLLRTSHLDKERLGIKNKGKEPGHMWALDEIFQDKWEEGRKEGLTKGREEGLTKGRKEGLTKGRTEGVSTVIHLMLDQGMSPEEVRKFAPVNDEEFQEILRGHEEKMHSDRPDKRC